MTKFKFERYSSIQKFGFLALISASIGAFPQTAAAAPLQTVTTNADSGAGSLRAAIEAANASGYPTQIHFAINSGYQKICPLTPLPEVTAPINLDGTTQPGYTVDPVANNGINGLPLIEISGSCQTSFSRAGLVIKGNSSTINSIIVNGFGTSPHYSYVAGDSVINGVPIIDGILIEGVDNATIKGSFIGTNVLENKGPNITIEDLTCNEDDFASEDVDGTTNISSGTCNTGNGISIHTSSNIQIGGSKPEGRNLISGNGYRYQVEYEEEYVTVSEKGAGIQIGAESSNNTIINNLIGTDIFGSDANLGNVVEGIQIGNSPYNTVGGGAAAFRNIISGNGRYGIVISNRTEIIDEVPIPLLKSIGNRVVGNYIGTDISGTMAVPNDRSGILIFQAGGNFIGGTSSTLLRNVISGNTRKGITIDGSDTVAGVALGDAKENRVVGNYIGVDVSGNKALPNRLDGIHIFWGRENVIGGDTETSRNVISGNGRYGVSIQGCDPRRGKGDLDHLKDQNCHRSTPLEVYGYRNQVFGNYIGVGEDGTTVLGNGEAGRWYAGVRVKDSINNQIGGNSTQSPNSGNIIKNNIGYGVDFRDLLADTNTLGCNNDVSDNVHPTDPQRVPKQFVINVDDQMFIPC